MSYPQLTIDSQKIESNTRQVAALLKKQGMGLVAVAKGTAAHPAVVEAMIRGGAAALGMDRMPGIHPTPCASKEVL